MNLNHSDFEFWKVPTKNSREIESSWMSEQGEPAEHQTYSRHNPLAALSGVEPCMDIVRMWRAENRRADSAPTLRCTIHARTHTTAACEEQKKNCCRRAYFFTALFRLSCCGMTDWKKSSNRIDFNSFAQEKKYSDLIFVNSRQWKLHSPA